MRIVRPQPTLSDTDKALLELIAQLVLSFPDASSDTNVVARSIPLSDSEARELCDLLTQLLAHPDFVKGVGFVELMADPTTSTSDRAREAYLSGRTRAGKLRVMASRQWAEFQARLGLRHATSAPPSFAMSTEQFHEMERRLLEDLRVHPALSRQIRLLIYGQSPEMDRLRMGAPVLKMGQILTSVRRLTDDLKAMGSTCIPRTQLVGIATVVVDTSVLFTTRDWSVAGTLSAIAGGVAMSAPS